MYAIVAMRHFANVTNGGYEWLGSTQVPTFYLDENVQGIVDEDHAREIALEILGSGKYTITAVRI